MNYYNNVNTLKSNSPNLTENNHLNFEKINQKKDSKLKNKKLIIIIILFFAFILITFFSFLFGCAYYKYGSQPSETTNTSELPNNQSCGRDENIASGNFPQSINYLLNSKSIDGIDQEKFEKENNLSFIFSEKDNFYWKNNNKLISLPGLFYPIVYNNKNVISDYEYQIDELFSQAGFSINEDNNYTNEGISILHYKGYEKDNLKCQMSWEEDMISVLYVDDKYQSHFHGNNGDFYELRISCGYLNPEFEKEYSIFYNLLDEHNEENFIVIIDKNNGTFAEGTAGVKNTFSGLNWLAKLINNQWSIIYIKPEGYEGPKCTSLKHDVYDKYNVPLEFQNSSCN